MTRTSTFGRTLATLFVGILGLAGSPVCAVFLLAAFGFLWFSGVIGGILSILIAAALGVAVGFKLAFKWIDYAITNHPDVILQTYEKWKRNGKWDKLVAATRAQRSTAANDRN
jgi:O-antigen ligase